MTARIGVVLFPGSNCEHDAVEALETLGARAELIWHGDRRLTDVDAVVLPGGFAHGDYLRPGAIARFSPVMTAVEEFARSGGPVIGICNGFQVLTEAHLLPGALQKNRGLTFLCQPAQVEVASDSSVLTHGIEVGTRLWIPINHFEGNFTCDERTRAELEDQGRVVLRYVDNPNGSVGSIAGISNQAGNVVGLMPHPERAVNPLGDSVDGALLLGAFIECATSKSMKSMETIGSPKTGPVRGQES